MTEHVPGCRDRIAILKRRFLCVDSAPNLRRAQDGRQVVIRLAAYEERFRETVAKLIDRDCHVSIELLHLLEDRADRGRFSYKFDGLNPFFDRDFIDSVIAVRQEHKFKHRLYLEVMRRVAPQAASVTWQRTNIAPARGYLANLAAMAFHRAATQACAPFGFNPFRSLAVADTGGWLRGPWRRNVDEILFNNQTLDRGLVNPDVARQMWNSHLNGADHTRQLGVLIAIEFFARQMIDGTGFPGAPPGQTIRAHA